MYTSLPGAPTHVFADVVDRLCEPHRSAILAARPGKNSTKDQKIAAFERQDMYLQEHAGECLGLNARSFCRRHNKMCPVTWPGPGGGRLSAESADTSATPLSYACAGSMCTPWSSYGPRSGLSSEHTESFQIALTDLSFSGHDIIVIENSPNMPVELLMEKLNVEKYHCVWAYLGPEDIAWPAHRRRLLFAGIRRESLVWVGPSDQEGVSAYLQGLFPTQTCLDGSVFILNNQTTEEERQAWLTELAQRRAMEAPQGGFSAWPDRSQTQVEELLAPGQQQILEQYRHLSRVDVHWSSSRTCICDISQKPKARCRMSSNIPTVLTSTALWEAKRAHHFQPTEMDVSQGFPLEEAQGPYTDCVRVPLHECTRHKHRELLGNGMHLAALGAWHLFLFAHIQRRPVPSVPRLLAGSGYVRLSRNKASVQRVRTKSFEILDHVGLNSEVSGHSSSGPESGCAALVEPVRDGSESAVASATASPQANNEGKRRRISFKSRPRTESFEIMQP